MAQDSAGNIYGTTAYGGSVATGFSRGMGVVFKLSPSGVLEVLHNFSGADGATPFGLILGNDGNFYGETTAGGDLSLNGGQGDGTVFQITPAGTLNSLEKFEGNTSGAIPFGGLMLASDGMFYGVAEHAGQYGSGLIFRFGTSGPVTPVAFFMGGTNGAMPIGGLVQDSAGAFYGITASGGIYTDGTLYRFTTNGGLSTLYAFNAATNGTPPEGQLVFGTNGALYGVTYAEGPVGGGTVYCLSTNGDLIFDTPFNGLGSETSVGLLLASDGNFYGMTRIGGPCSLGTVFRVSQTGEVSLCAGLCNVDGAEPEGGLTQAKDGNFYGTAFAGGVNGFNGTVFKLSTNANLTSLVSFNQTNGSSRACQLLQLSDGSFFRTTKSGGSNNMGTIFRVTTNGSLTTVFMFDGTNGSEPNSPFVFGPGNTIFGTTSSGGPIYESGTVFSADSSGEVTTLVSFPVNLGLSTEEGVEPNGLIQGRDGALYGATAISDYPSYSGSLFRMTTSGTYSNLFNFVPGDGSQFTGALVQGLDGNLYGVSVGDGAYNEGTVFGITTNGILKYAASSDTNLGGFPSAPLIQGADGNFYGETRGNNAGNVGAIFRTEIGNPPLITFPPPFGATVAQYVGSSVTLTVSATGATPFYYQWFYNLEPLTDGGRISGSTNSKLTISPILPSDGASYSIFVGNALGGATAAIRVYVLAPASMTVTNFTVTSGGRPGFSFTGTSNVNYDIWASSNLMNWLPLGLATQTTPGSYYFNDAAVTNYQSRFYQVRVP
jgi:uncharacterized repeat protein (TIGR03803 family)